MQGAPPGKQWTAVEEAGGSEKRATWGSAKKLPNPLGQPARTPALQLIHCARTGDSRSLQIFPRNTGLRTGAVPTQLSPNLADEAPHFPPRRPPGVRRTRPHPRRSPAPPRPASSALRRLPMPSARALPGAAPSSTPLARRGAPGRVAPASRRAAPPRSRNLLQLQPATLGGQRPPRPPRDGRGPTGNYALPAPGAGAAQGGGVGVPPRPRPLGRFSSRRTSQRTARSSTEAPSSSQASAAHSAAASRGHSIAAARPSRAGPAAPP